MVVDLHSEMFVNFAFNSKANKKNRLIHSDAFDNSEMLERFFFISFFRFLLIMESSREMSFIKHFQDCIVIVIGIWNKFVVKWSECMEQSRNKYDWRLEIVIFLFLFRFFVVVVSNKFRLDRKYLCTMGLFLTEVQWTGCYFANNIISPELCTIQSKQTPRKFIA